jgi:hypothetical protein
VRGGTAEPIAGAARARLALECLRDEFSQNAHTMLEQAEAAGASYVKACSRDKLVDARPFFIPRQGDCRDPRRYRCATIPWQGR